MPQTRSTYWTKGWPQEPRRCRRFRVLSSETKTVPQAPPAPYTTSTLLQAASVSLGYKPDLTSQLAQKLFEQGLITYHRTDSQNFGDEALSEIRAFAQRHEFPIPTQARRWKAKDSAQGAHEAIRPTHLEMRAAGEDAAQRALYSLIWNRAVASQLADAMFNVNTVKLESLDSDQKFLFKAVGLTLLSPGWKSLIAKDAAEEDEPNSADDETPNGGTVPSLASASADRDHPDRNVRYSVACALGCFPNNALSLSVLISLTRDEDSDVREWSVFGLGVLGSTDSPEIREALLNCLSDGDEDVHEEAAVGLGKRQELRLLPALRRMLDAPVLKSRVAEAASGLLGLSEDPPEWGAANYKNALNEKYGPATDH